MEKKRELHSWRPGVQAKTKTTCSEAQLDLRRNEDIEAV